MNGNKMERFDGEAGDREKVMRGPRKDGTLVLKGYKIYQNHLRPHAGLDGKAPAEACGVEIKGENMASINQKCK